MKKLLLLIVTLIAVTTYAQKAEYKAAYKAFDKGNIIDAQKFINKACQQKDEADGKLKSKIIFLKAKIYADLGDVNYDNYVISVKSIDELINFEKQIHKNRYTDKAKLYKKSLAERLIKISTDLYGKNEYEKSAGLFEIISTLLEGDESDEYKYFAAVANFQADNFKKSVQLYEALYDSGYTGVKTIYTIKDKTTGERVEVPSETQGKLFAKTNPDRYEDFKIEKKESIRPQIIGNVLYLYNKLGEDDKALNFINKAKAENPNNVDLLLGEADYYHKKSDNKKYLEIMKNVVNLTPKDVINNYNLGIAYLEANELDNAVNQFNKALEIDPNYMFAYKGIIKVLLTPEAHITEELNKDSVLSDDKLYDKYTNELNNIYKKVLPVLEKARLVDGKDKDILIMLKGVYTQLEMTDKRNEVKEVIKSLKEDK